LGQLGRDHHLLAGGGRLGVVALQGAAVAPHEPAVGVGGVDRRLGIGASSRRRGRMWARDVGRGLGRRRPARRPAAGSAAGGRRPRPPTGPWPVAAGPVARPGQPAPAAAHRPRRRRRPRVFGLVGGRCLLEQLGDLRLEVGVGAVGRGAGRWRCRSGARSPTARDPSASLARPAPSRPERAWPFAYPAHSSAGPTEPASAGRVPAGRGPAG
jgi:hypothetical protein